MVDPEILALWKESTTRLRELREARLQVKEDARAAEARFIMEVWSNRSGSQWKRDGERYCQRIKECGITGVRLMTESQSSGGYSLSKFGEDPASLLRTCLLIKEQGLTVGLTTWPEPTKREIDRLIDGDERLPGLPQLCVDTDARLLEFDAEGGNWDHEYVRGFKDLDEASTYLHSRLHAKRAELGGDFRIGVSTHHGRTTKSYTILSGSREVAGVPTPWVDECAIQVYSKYAADEPDRWWGAKYGPGSFQEAGLKKIRGLQINELPEAGLGVPSWNQEYPVHAGGGRARPGEESMVKAMCAAYAQGCRNLCLWELSFVMENAYVLEAMKAFASALVEPE